MSRRAAKKPRQIELEIAAKVGRAYVPFLRRHLAKALLVKQTRLQSLSVALVGDALMAKLHQQFMKLAGPTDVLTFELDMDSKGRVVAGEVVICVPEAKRRAREHGTRTEHELLLYAIHGMLHLSGYDDHTEADFRAIHREEDRILSKLGIGPVFHAGSDGGARSKKDGLSR